MIPEQILDFARSGDFERALKGLFESAGPAAPPELKFIVRFDPLRHFQPSVPPDFIRHSTAYRSLSRALDSLGTRGRRRAEYWGLKAALEFLYSRPRQVLSAGDHAVRLDPGWAWAFLWRARARGVRLVSLRQSRLQALIPPLVPELRRVLSDYDIAEKLDPGNRDVYAWRAQFLNSLDQEEAGMADLQKALKIDPSYDWAYSLLGDTFSELHRGEEALGVCREMFKRFSKRAWAYAYRGRERGKAGLHRPACDDLKRAMLLDPKLAGLNAWIGESIRKQGDYSGALVWMDRALKAQPDNDNALVWKARLLNAHWRVEESLDCLRRASQSRRYFDEHFHLLRGEALLKAGRFEAAAEDFDRAFPSSPTTLWSPPLKNGSRAAGEDRKTALSEDMERVLRDHPRNAWALAFRGMLLTQQEHGLAAATGLSDLNEAIRLSPENAWARSWRARSRLKMGWVKEAFQDMDLCLTLKKDHASFWAWSGVLRLEAKDLRRAEYDFTRALRLGPGLGGFYSYRGRVRCLLGDHENGLADLEEGLLRGPRTGEWRSWRQEAGEALKASSRKPEGL